MLKKLLTIILAVSLLGVFSSANAVTIGFGVESDFTINRDVKGGGSEDASYSAQHYDVVADIAVGDTFTISPKAGFTKATIEESSEEVDSKLGSNFGTDAKVKLYKGDVNIDLLGKYRYSQVKFKDSIDYTIDYYYYDGDEFDYIGSGSGSYEYTIKAKLHEYEVGPVVSKSFGKDVVVTPYVGGVYSDVRGKLTAEGETIKIKAKDNIGLRLGTSVKLANNINLFIDGALIDKQGVSAKITYIF